MGAPTGYPESDDILGRLETVLDDDGNTRETPEETQETKEKIEIEPPSDTPPHVEEGGDPPPIAAEGEGEGEQEASASEEASSAEQGEEEVSTLSDLAKVFEVEEADFLESIQVDSGDGERVALSKVLSTYKNAPEAARKFEEFKAKEEAFASEAAQLRTKTDENIRELAVHAQVLLDMTNEEFKDVDWNKLKDEDPANYLFMKERQRERGQAIQGAIEKMKGLEQQRTEEVIASNNANRVQEIQKLHEKKPEWKKPEVAQEAMNDTSTFLADLGFTQEEINGITDHRYLLVAYEAAQYRKLQKQAPEKLEKLRGLPKPKYVLRSTARRDSRSDAQQNAQKKLDRLRQTGDENDAARLFEELL